MPSPMGGRILRMERVSSPAPFPSLIRLEASVLAGSLLAVTLLGFTFSGREAAIAAVAVVVVVAAAWFVTRRRR